MASVYVHVPFCRQRCSYCDFYFVTSLRDVDRFVAAVRAEIKMRTSELDEAAPVETIYFGGGTPSRLDPVQFEAILGSVRKSFPVIDSAEVTVEVNPEDVTPALLTSLRATGVTRLSLGIQSLYPSDLQFMNRSHDDGQARRAVELALSAGFASVSLDLIFGLPDMTVADWEANLAYAVASGVQHVSLYGLTVEPKTVLGKLVRSGKVVPAAEDRMESQYRLAHDVITAAGFEHYEISNFARMGHRSRHNGAYWNHSDYIGFGPSAHSFSRTPAPRRSENPRSLRRYLDSIESGLSPVSNVELLDDDVLMQEFVFLGLRTSDGVDLSKLSSDYGYKPTDLGREELDRLNEGGFLRQDGDVIRLTLDGFLVADSINATLLLNECFERVPRHSGR